LIGTRFAAAPTVPPDLVWAWRRLAETRGSIGVGSLADELGCSRKHLAGRFSTHIGLPPKTVGRILRFDAVVDALRADPGGKLSLAELAGRCGY
jgi:AraC-like DNA-binding protein